MNRVLLNSPDLHSVGYDAKSEVLEIELLIGGVYHFYGVPAAKYQGLMTALSYSQYFTTFIRDGYRAQRIS